MGHDDHGANSPFLVSTKDFFSEIVSDAFERRRLKTFPQVKGYLVGLLEFYVPASNLFDECDSSGRRVQETLAETLLKAQSSEPMVRIELLKKLGDRSLYISGFFGDSLQRKLVDIDYYADMGGMAYGSLAETVREDTLSKVYREFSFRFLEFAEVLTYISSRAKLHNEENIMRLYETYARTGSDLAREKLIEKGLIAVPQADLKFKKQQ
jgi:Mor family transcriptional regulator